MQKKLAALVLACALLAPFAPAHAGSLAGVTVPDTAEVDGDRLVLNGMGLREKFFIDVYVAALYLPEKQRSERAILAGDGPRRTEMHFLYDVSKDQICDAWSDGLEGNRPDAPAEVAKQFDTLCSWMEDMTKGDAMVFTYVPGEGTTVSVKGEKKGTVGAKAFSDALLASLIGEKPATGKLKKGLLGG